MAHCRIVLYLCKEPSSEPSQTLAEEDGPFLMSVTWAIVQDISMLPFTVRMFQGPPRALQVAQALNRHSLPLLGTLHDKDEVT